MQFHFDDYIKFSTDYEVKAANGAKYKAGDIVSMSLSGARHFVRRGVAAYWTGRKKKAPEASSENPGDPKAVGGGMYELPDGTRVKGKDAAAKAMEKIKVSKIQPEPDRAAIAQRTLSDI